MRRLKEWHAEQHDYRLTVQSQKLYCNYNWPSSKIGSEYGSTPTF